MGKLLKVREIWQSIRRVPIKEVLHQREIAESLRGFPYWTAAVVVGFIAVLYSTAFNHAIELAQGLAVNDPYLFIVLAPFCFMLGSYLVDRFAPEAGGTGVPQVVSAISLDPVLDYKKADRILSLRVAAISVLSSLACILGGGGMGREGPMVLIAACLFVFVGKRFNRFWAYGEHRSWIIAGGAAGIAAAFQTPLAGVIFVIEELTQQYFHGFRTYVISAVVIAGMMAQWLYGRYLYLGYARIGDVPSSAVLWAVLLGIVCGSSAAVFEWVVVSVRGHTLKVFGEKRLALAAFLGLIVACIAVFVDHRSVGGGIKLIEELLFKDEAASWRILAGRFLSTILGHLSGCAGGFLAPSLSLGAVIGSKFAWLIEYPSHKLMVMVGMAGFLGAITRAPFTALVIVMEMTDSHAAIFPLMLASVAAYGTIRLLAGRFAK